MSVEAYMLGRGDYVAGRTIHQNRFIGGTTLYNEWRRGWRDAVKADPLLEDDEKEELLSK